MTNNPCIRCGKARIVSSIRQEYVGTSLITYTDTVCPDPECQEKVNEQLLKEREKREKLVTKYQQNKHYY